MPIDEDAWNLQRQMTGRAASLLKLRQSVATTGIICSPADASVPADDRWKTWQTRDHLRLAPVESTVWTPLERSSGGDFLTIRSDRTYQTILGLGAAFTDGAGYLFNQLSTDARAQLFHTLFHPSEMGLNLCRTCVGSSDNSATLYSFDDGDADSELKCFSIEHDRAYILPMLGGCMRHTDMPACAKYFVKFLRAYEAEGVPVQVVTVQNEVDADQDGTMPACAWPQDYEADFLTMHLGPLFQRAGVPTKIWIIDHNYILWGRAIGELETPDARKYTNAIAWHGYVGEPQWIGRVQDAFPDVEMYWTEGGPDYKASEYAREWPKWGETFTAILKNSCRSITVWILASDENGRPYVGAGATGIGGAMLINPQTHEISYSGMFWALGHFSKFIRRGAKRIDSQGELSRVSHCAFENPDGCLVVVVTNSGPKQDFRIQLLDKVAAAQLAAGSITTLVCPAPPYA